jgi:hypothetical protein
VHDCLKTLAVMKQGAVEFSLDGAGGRSTGEAGQTDFLYRITANHAGAEVDRTAGGGETWVGIIAMPAERYSASNGRYAVP